MVITNVHLNDSYRIVSLTNRGDHQFATTAHVSNFKSFHFLEEDPFEGSDTNED